MDLKEKLLRLESERKSLPESPRRRMIIKEIEELKLKFKFSSDPNLAFPSKILVKNGSHDVGFVRYNQEESSFVFVSGNNESEIGFTYNEIRSWASTRGFTLRFV